MSRDTRRIGDALVTIESATLQAAATAAAVGVAIDCSALSVVGFQITGTSTSRTIQFDGSVDGSNYVAIQAVNAATAAVATSTTATGEIWQIDVAGLASFRANLTAVAGGNVTVTARGQ